MTLLISLRCIGDKCKRNKNNNMIDSIDPLSKYDNIVMKIIIQDEWKVCDSLSKYDNIVMTINVECE